jgi:hypothetical protein
LHVVASTVRIVPALFDGTDLAAELGHVVSLLKRAYPDWARASRVVRVNERETGFFEDVAALLDRLVPLSTSERDRLLCFLLGPRSEQVPFKDGRLCLGTWQRILVIGFDESSSYGWHTTVVG